MLKTLHAYTVEIDDPDEAVDEILGQIHEDALLAHSVGVLGCHLEYITNGTVKALCEKLPFDVVGSTTNVSDLCGNADEYQLVLMVLTSDDIEFASGVSAPLSGNAEESIAQMYEQIAKATTLRPSFGIFFAPFMLDVSADLQLKSLEKASNNLALFGTVALDYVENVRDPRTIYGGGDFADCMAFLLVAGEVCPDFFMQSISQERFLAQKAIVSSSEGNLLKEVNNIPAINYLESLGLAKEGAITNIPLVPLSVDVGDGARPAARAIFAVIPDGVVCGGDMPEGAALGVASLDADDVQNTATVLANEVAHSTKKNGAIIFSCIGRNRALGLDPMHEIEKIKSVLGEDIPYLFMYSGGEICPEYVDGKPLNKALNDSIIACVF